VVKFDLNGEPCDVDEPLSVRDLLVRFDLVRGRVAVAINGDVVPRSSFDERKIQDGDRVEVIHAVGGG
jgi:sulfur carrier protein